MDSKYDFLNGCNLMVPPTGDKPEISVTKPETPKPEIAGEKNDPDSPVIKNHEEQNAEEINLNGIKCTYIAIQTNLSKDKILGEDVNPYAIEIYENIKIRQENNSFPAATNTDNMYGMLGWVSNDIYQISKLDFRRKTTAKNLSNELGLFNKDWIPKPGDIIWVNLPPYNPVLEVIDTDDDLTHFLGSRPNWVLTVQSYTKKLIDFTYIKNKYGSLYNQIQTAINPIDENVVNDDGTLSSNTMFDTNKFLEDDERNMNSVEQTKEENLFRSIFGD